MNFLFNVKKYDKIVKICLLGLLILFNVINPTHGQVSPYATYQCGIKVDSKGNGSIFVVYAVFAGDQSLQISSEEIYFPVYNSSAVLENTTEVRDNYGKELTWSWEDSKEFLKVLIGPVNITAGGKYEVRTGYDQQHLSQIVNETHYFVYKWDFSKIMYSPYAIRKYAIEVQGPAYAFFDSYPIDYIGASPDNLNNYIIQSGPNGHWTVSLTYTFSVSDVTLNVYYRHKHEIPMFTILMIMMIPVSLAILIIAMRRRKVRL